MNAIAIPHMRTGHIDYGRNEVCYPDLQIRIANRDHVAAVWGLQRAKKFATLVRERLSGFEMGFCLGSGAFLTPRSEHELAHALCDGVCAIPVDLDGDLVHAVLAVEGCKHGAPSAGSVPSSSEDADRYRVDMRTVAEAFRLHQTGRIMFAWQPIRDHRNGGSVVYSEALLRLGEGGEVLPGPVIDALERIGLARVFDRIVVEHVLGELEQHHDISLGVNLSAQSTSLGGWRDSLAATFRERPDLAKRLIIEITESAPMSSALEAVTFADAMRSAGARIALDDFGTGYHSMGHLFALSPAIVKLDGQLTRQLGSCAKADAVFSHLAGLAAAVGAAVVAEGVEVAEQAERAQAAGAAWQQGYFHGFPARSLAARQKDARKAYLAQPAPSTPSMNELF